MTTAAQTKSANPAYPDAHPTAPGGMSRAALVKELIEVHDYEKSTKAAWDAVSWPDLINLVIEGRREAEQAAAVIDAASELLDVLAEPLADIAAEYNEVEMFGGHLPVSDMFDILDEYEDEVLTTLGSVEKIAGERKQDEPEGMDSLTDSRTEAAPVLAGIDLWSEAIVANDGWLDPETMFAEMTQARAAEHAARPPLFIGLPVVKDYIFDGHAGAGPSGAERWMNCTMSLSASRAFLETLSPNQQHIYAGANTAARQGTTAHAAAEVEANMVLGRVSSEEVDYTLMELSVMPDDEGEAYDDEMAEYITEYVDLIKSYAQERGDDHVMVESRVEADIPLAGLHEGDVYVIRGSADAVVLPAKSGPPETRTLVVGDLKYGNGIDVDVDENPQIRIYALGVLALLADKETGELPTWLDDIVYHIVQPRLGGIKTWTESIEDLLTWRDEVLSPALTLALYGAAEGATYNPSELACQFCPARGSCPALTEQRVEQAAGLFDVIVESEFEQGPGAFPETTTLTDTRLGELLTMAAGLHDIYKDLREEAQRRLHRGGAVPGYQLVSYTPPRKWTPKAAEVLAGVEAIWKEPTMMTPTQALKVLKGNEEDLALVEGFVEAPDKRPIIAKVGDRRKTWEGKPPEQMFADESDTGDEA